ncbi:hypothetical protein [Intestinimonas sp.]|uniref:hypothetical protein n=1 Tax=Intestinimonas sp. TaxID=1965293 RepID=UPI0026089227|nr:hypothetical protein [Intestinimonas sp.]
MASNYTANYGLCQWEPGDKFLREEFNQDNGKIDGAIKAAEDRAASAAEKAQAAADRALSGLEDQGYNLYNLLLQQYYGGKKVDFKKALIFDGFLDGSMTASMSNGVVRSQNKLTLDRTGQGDIPLGYSGQSTSYVGGGSTATCTAGGSGRITGFRLKTIHEQGLTVTSSATWKLYKNGKQAVQGTAQLRFGAAAEEQTISISSVSVSKGDTFYLHIQTGADIYELYTTSNGLLGGTFLITSTGTTGGTVTTPSLALPERTGLRAWVRHSGGTVALSVQGGTGWLALTQAGSRTTMEPGGASCTETEFLLEEGTPQGEHLSFQLTMDVGNAAAMYVYDYGILLF